MTFMSNYINTVLKLPLHLSLMTSMFSFVLLIILMPIMGHLSDKVGRKPMLYTSCFGFLLLSYPLFQFIGDGVFWKILVAQFVLAVLLSMFSGTAVAFIAEIFTTQVRTSSLVGYNIMAALAGGMAPFFAMSLVKMTGNNSSPAFYLMGCIVVSIITIATVPESYDKPLK